MFIKKICSDFGLNIIASIILTAVMQLIVYPKIAAVNSVEAYGLILTVMGILNTIIATFGNGLNNLRLITNVDYVTKKTIGDFNILLAITLIVVLVVFLGGFFFLKFTMLQFIGFCTIAILGIIYTYLNVSFRLVINYKKNLVLNILMCIAYCIMIKYYTASLIDNESWFLIFLVAEIVAVAYLFFETNLLSEPLVKTPLFKSTAYRYINLIYLTLVGNVMVYMDRNLLLPLLGGESVAVFFAATVVGKAIGILTQPIAGVLLSYLSQVDFTMTRKKFWKINAAICFSGFLGYIATILVVNFAVNLLYPTLYEQAKPYLYVANLIPILGVIGSMAQPSILRYVSLTKQSLFQTIYLVLTGMTCYYAVLEFGLWGFCWALVCLSCFRIAILWTLGHIVLK